MTEQKPVAWTYEYHNGERWKRLLVKFDPSNRGPDNPTPIRNVQAWYAFGVPVETPPAPVDAKPVAWLFESNIGSPDWRLYVSEDEPDSYGGRRRNIRPVYEHPPAPAAPVTTPEVEAARRKALKVILTYLEREKYTSDLYGVRLALGVLRDLAGQPRRFPDTRIGDYDEPNYVGLHRADKIIIDDEPLCADVCHEATPDHVPEKGPERPVPLPARLSAEDVARIVAGTGATCVDITNVWVKRIAEAIHEAIYGKGDE